MEVGILAPLEVKGGDTIPLKGVCVVVRPGDPAAGKRKQMCRSLRPFLTDLYGVGWLTAETLEVLASIIRTGSADPWRVFFQLYGRFQGVHGVKDGKETLDAMRGMVGEGDTGALYPGYVYRGKRSDVPLPYAVRTIMAHPGNPNELDEKGEQVERAVALLRAWTV